MAPKIFHEPSSTTCSVPTAVLILSAKVSWEETFCSYLKSFRMLIEESFFGGGGRVRNFPMSVAFLLCVKLELTLVNVEVYSSPNSVVTPFSSSTSSSYQWKTLLGKLYTQSCYRQLRNVSLRAATRKDFSLAKYSSGFVLIRAHFNAFNLS